MASGDSNENNAAENASFSDTGKHFKTKMLYFFRIKSDHLA